MTIFGIFFIFLISAGYAKSFSGTYVGEFNYIKGGCAAPVIKITLILKDDTSTFQDDDYIVTGKFDFEKGYGPVSVAKVAMEAIIRQIGWELGSKGITANSVQAGVTPTRALTKITENWEHWVKNTKKRNPMKRTTEPEDVANVISLLLRPEADFINCSIVYCDGGESRSGTI